MEDNKLWWLSFAGFEEGNKGMILVEAPTFVHAVARTWKLAINPGGEVMGFEIAPGGKDDIFPHETLISTETLKSHGYLPEKV